MKNVFINSVPKSGTNLLQKLFDMSGYRFSNKSIASSSSLGDYELLKQLIRGGVLSRSKVSVGIEVDGVVSERWLRKTLSGLPAKNYVTGHANYSSPLFDALNDYDYIMFYMIRDPRDTILSHVNYAGSFKGHLFYREFSELDFDEKLKLAINGGRYRGYYMKPYLNALQGCYSWFGKDIVNVIRFEDLVGKKGGGCDIKQKECLELIGSKVDIGGCNVLENLYGGTHTFNKGVTRQWEDLDCKSRKYLCDNLSEAVELFGYKS